jgi:hypothetical protein
MARSTPIAAVGLALSLFLVLVAPAAAASLPPPPPTITYSIEGISGTNGWYRGSIYGDNVILHWSVVGATSPTCLPVTIPGPTTGTTETCSAWNGPTSATVTTSVKIDATPPTVSASITRKPDFNGWYNHPVTVRWSGTDATSGVARCSVVTYRGPENAAATVNGSCTDKAGNSAGQPVHLAYDATPPVLSKVTEQSTAGANVLHWSSSAASDRVVVRRAIRGSKAHKTVVDAGAGTAGFADRKILPGAQYVYSVQSFDEAGNASRVVTVAGLPKVLTLRKTGYVPHVTTNPIFRWQRFRGAGYYNVQLFRGSKRIYAAWPTAHHLGLPESWKWSKRRFRLTPGRYRWYVWAGLGARTLARYRSVGSASFIVPHP